MAVLLQLAHTLATRPQISRPSGVQLRHFSGPDDIPIWLDLRSRAFARERVGVGHWDPADFAREFLGKPWWRPEWMWFAEVQSPSLSENRLGEGDSPILLPRHRKIGTVPDGSRIDPEPELPWEPVGTIALAQRGEGPLARPVVHWLAVVPAFRRRGIGRQLVATLEAVVWDAGGRQVWLETHSKWDAAVRLYRALGYEPVSG